ncbi:MAG: DUF1553 domain-containing protein [Planctomycetota bacterium]
MQTRVPGFLFLAASVICGLDASPALAQAPAKQIDFSRDIKPILSNKCFLCHGPSETDRKGGKNGLRLDTAAGSIEDLGGHAAIVPGKPEASEMIVRILTKDPEEIMPPATSGKTLTPHEIELLQEWVRQGAHYSLHWSYIKPTRPVLPMVRDTAWPKNDLDRFLLSRLETEQLQPSPEADRYALVRRVTLDLTGLPPTLEEVDAFVNDADPQAYEKLVDRLLQKSAYGEHWANLWLDLSRYADSAGYADDPARKIWLFRDYVIRALNENKSFDQFTIEQLAGDLLPNPTDQQLIATAFHRNTLTNSEGGTNDEEFRTVAVVDRVNTTMAVWMGTTMACCQCHDHKYDPISQEEYFRFYAFFNNTADADRNDESPLAMIYTDDQKRQKSLWEEERSKLELIAKTTTPELQASQAKWEAAFPLHLAWLNAKPASVKSTAGTAVSVADDGVVKVAAGAKTDTYTVDLNLPESTVRALRLEALPDPALPGNGPGNAGGNFVVTKISAMLNPPTGTTLSGRYVRVELPGKGRMLSLAEVQAFQGAENIAPKGEAKQSSTDYAGPAQLANDGNTDGRYNEAKSTTHTAISDDPWWELDLKAEQKLDRLVVWNRVDPGTVERLVNFKITVLNEKREPVWHQDVAAAPQPSAELSLSGRREIEFSLALADYAQTGFDPATVLKNPDPKNKGWAVGGQTGQAHTLTLIPKAAIEAIAGSTLTVTIEQNSGFENHTLGQFRLSTTDDPHVAEVSRTSTAVLEALRVPAANRQAPQLTTISSYFLSIAPELAATRKQLSTLQQQLTELKPETVPVMKELPQDQRRLTKIQHRGNFLDLGADVTEGTPATFPGLPEGAPRNRLTLAKWVMSDDNPLTARVIANRYWEQIFGVGIVLTSEEFGAQGDQPFHPELLDWLATEMVRLKWDTKAFLRLLVTSAAYRQTSKVSPELQQRDPDNRLLARGPRFRLSAETLRDQALLVSGLLSPKMYGAPVKPQQPSLGLSAAFGSGIDWQTSSGSDKYRRGLYTTWRRSSPYPSMATFDAPNREVCTVRRIRTNTPLQALVTLNDPVYIEAAQALARRMVSAGGKTPAERLAYGFRLCLARPPHPTELARLVKLYEDALLKYGQNVEEARKMAMEPLGAPPAEMSIPELAALTVVGNVLLNLDEALMKR